MDLELQAIAACFDRPITEAARALGTCTTNLKKACRAHGIARWPYRKMRSIETSLEKLQQYDKTNQGKGEVLIKELLRQKQAIMSANHDSSVQKLKKGRSRARLEAESSSDESFEACVPRSGSFKRAKKASEIETDEVECIIDQDGAISSHYMGFTLKEMIPACFSFAPSVLFAGTPDLHEQPIPLQIPIIDENDFSWLFAVTQEVM